MCPVPFRHHINQSQAAKLAILIHTRTQRVKEKQWDVLSSIHEGYHSPLHVKGSFDFERNKFGAMLPIELTNEEIRNSNAYKEYSAVATGAAPPKPNASVQKTRSSFDTTITPSTAAAGPRLTTSDKGKQTTHISQASGFGADEGTSSIPGVPDVPTDESKEELSWNSTDEEGDDDEGKNGDGDEEDEGDDGEEGDGDDDD
nr:hypothetical protein [Tanacetum cinerariifolium]